MDASEANSTRVVISALLGNLAIALCKFAAAFYTGSVAALAEAVHSVADTGNQVLLLLGMKLAERDVSEQHPFGRAIERYFWPFIVAIMLFTIGGCFAAYEGFHKLSAVIAGEHEHHAHSNFWNYVVLGTSFVFESYSCSVAWSEFRKMKGRKSTVRTMVDARDPTIPVVILEDVSALLGLAIALLGVGLSDLTGWGGFDGIASALIGVLLCAVAVFLARETHSLIIGESATPEDRAKVREVVEGTPRVRRLLQLQSLHRGPDDVLLAIKVDFERGMDIDEVEATINLLEERVRAALPKMRHIFVEPDSAYDAAKDARPKGAIGVD